MSSSLLDLLGPRPPGIGKHTNYAKELRGDANELIRAAEYRQAQLNKKIRELELYLKARHKNELNSGEMTNQQIKIMARSLATKKPQPRDSTMERGGKRKTHKRNTLKRKTHKRR